jgi:putative hydrolase of the HAD superfamily
VLPADAEPAPEIFTARPYPDGVTRIQACLVDVYDTLLSCDFLSRRTELPRMAGVPAQAWREGYKRIDSQLNTGKLSKAEGFELILRESGVDPRPDLVRALLATDRKLLYATARLYDDALPFLRAARAAGLKIAIVSNCGEQTRELLVELGVAALADVLVLSCEVGAAKPAARIFRQALDQLDVTAGTALFVDDQAAYCAGAVAVGIAAVQIVRGEPDGNTPAAGTTVVRSLPEVEAMLWS